jgi:hypothetical protein
MGEPLVPRAAAQMESQPYPDWRLKLQPMRLACEAAGPEWEVDGKHFEMARGKVARILHWKRENVMDWEVLSYLQMERPAWAERAGLVFP